MAKKTVDRAWMPDEHICVPEGRAIEFSRLYRTESNGTKRYSRCIALTFDSFSECGRASARHSRLKESGADIEKVITGKTPASSSKYEWMGLKAAFPGRKVKDAEDLVHMVFEEWKGGLEMLTEMSGKLKDTGLKTPRTRLRTVRWDECGGDEVCIDRIKSGQPSFWRQTRRKFTTAPSDVTMLLDVGQNCQHKWSDALWRCAAAIAAAEHLELAGYNVEIHAYNLARHAYYDCPLEKDLLTSVKVKAKGAPIDRALVVNACSGWVFRSLYLRLLGYLPMVSPHHPTGRVACGLGSHGRIKPDHCKYITPDENCLVFDEVWSAKDAVKIAQSALASVDPELFYELDKETSR